MAGLDLATRVSTAVASYTWDKPVAPLLAIRPHRPQAPNRSATWSPTTSASSATFCAAWCTSARASPWCPRSLRPKTCSRSSPTASFSPTAPAIPSRCEFQAQQVRKLIGKKPIFGICLGHQILGLALGGKTYKLKFGHRGANHPVLNPGHRESGDHLAQSRLRGGSRFAERDSEVELTHINLNDQTLEGFRHRSEPVFCVQYHPEAAPGPHDSHYLFDDFMKLMQASSRSTPEVAECRAATTSTAS